MGTVCPIGVPHFAQNFIPGDSLLPHFLQKFAISTSFQIAKTSSVQV
jgi:hypothetical protein